MNLPLVFDLALGLIFIYLILSLLASEIQELITTLLQWRAEHLKKSIEILVGGSKTASAQDSEGLGIEFANRLYKHPIIRSLNQEAKGPLAKLFRSISYAFEVAYRKLTGGRNVFDDLRSGPSYIPAASFAAALLEELNLDLITHQQSCRLLGSATERRLQMLRDLVTSLGHSSQSSALASGLDALEQGLAVVRSDCSSRRISFKEALDAVISQCMSALEGAEAVLQSEPEDVKLTLQRQLPHLRQAIAFREQEPTMVESVELILAENERLPDQLKNTLVALARDVDTVADATTRRVNDFESRVSNWFSRSMDRASGVYKRNARGVAILIGCLIAVSTNTDTFYIVNRLSKDSVLRQSITQTANQIAAQPPTAGGQSAADELEEVSNAVNEALENLPLPIGWNPAITQTQSQQASAWKLPILRRIAGWLITGIAISMGASFWYGILGRIVRVRNTGDVPPDARSSD
ncbi:MAG: hypothetical protein AAF289_04090 [Cyanobacteria bacterium P01_A01_bin.135]